MTDHYREAERLLAEAEYAGGGLAIQQHMVAKAQVHATLALAAAERTTPVSGPHPIHVQPIPAGAALDISEYVADLIVSIATSERLLACFDDVVAALGDDRPGDPERLPVEHLVAQLNPHLHVYGRQVGALADRLREIARTQSRPVAVPQGGAAA